MATRWIRLRARTAVVSGVVVLTLVGTGVWWFGFRAPATASAATPTTTTQDVAAALTTLEKSVAGTGTVAPVEQDDLSFTVSGTVTAVDVAAGQTVKAGQTLATVDTLQLDANLLQAKATLATAQATLADKKAASDGSTAAVAQIAAAAAQVDVAQAQVTSATTAMAGATLVSPVAGLVTTASLAVGDVVQGTGSGGSGGSGGSSTTSSATGQFVVIDTSSWVVNTTVSESDVALIKDNDQVDLTLDGVSTPVFGTVQEIGLLSTGTSGVAAYPVTVAVTGSPAGLHDGISATVSIIYERRTDVLTVPSAAIRSVNGQSVVMKVGADGKAVSTPVTVGETSGQNTEIVSGLAEGDQVAVTVVAARTQNGTGGTRGVGGFGGGGFGGGGRTGRTGGAAGFTGGGFPGGPTNG